MKQRFLILTALFLLIALNYSSAFGQKLNYKCTSFRGHSGKLLVTPAKKPIKYQKGNIFVNKYVLSMEGQNSLSFFLYKYKNRLHIIEKFENKISPETDQVLFSMPALESYSLSSPSFLEKSALVLINSTNVNGIGFYKYDVMTNQPNLKLSEIIFDRNLDIAELKMAAGSSTCTYTKSNITIQLRQR